MNTPHATPVVNCPPGCVDKDAPWNHDLEFGPDGNVEIGHEVRFGDLIWGYASEHPDGTPTRYMVRVSVDVEGIDFTPEHLRKMASLMMAAASWREACEEVSALANTVDEAATDTVERQRYVTIAQAAEAMGRKPFDVLRLVEAGEIQAIEHDGRPLVRVDDVEQLGGVL